MSIQDLREQREALVVEARKLLDDNTGDKWTAAISEKVDQLYAAIDSMDGRIRAYSDGLAQGAGRFEGRSIRAASGAVFPVISNGPDLQRQLERALPAEHTDVNAADFFRAVAGIGPMREPIRAALSEGTDSAGGFALPAYLQQQFLQALVPQSSLLTAGAGVALLNDGAKSYRFPAVSTIPTAAWRNESAAVATSDPVFRAVDVVPRSLAVQFRVSRELLADGVGIEDALMTAMAQSAAKELDRAGLRGSGTAPEPRGILNTSGVQLAANGANGASLATTAYTNFISALQALLAADAPMPSGAIMAPRSLTTLAGLLDTTNQPRRVPPILEKVPFISTSQIPVNLTVGTSTDCSEIFVGDFSKLLVCMREQPSVSLLRELYAGTGEVGFLLHARVDVAVLYPAAFAVVTGVRA